MNLIELSAEAPAAADTVVAGKMPVQEWTLPVRARSTPNLAKIDTDRGYDLLRPYFLGISRTPLLSRDQERELGALVRRGDDAARDHMIRANLRLVVKIARRYEHRGLPLADLISAGNLGLIRAVDRFEPQRETKLSIYAGIWIRQAILRLLTTQSRLIRLPAQALSRISVMREEERRLTERLGRTPTDHELAAELQVPEAKVAHLKSVSGRAASLDARVDGEAGPAALVDVIPDPAAASPCELLKENERYSDLSAMIEALDPREAEIIKARFGLQGRSRLSLEMLGRRFGVSRERIRQLERRALCRLRVSMNRRETARSLDEIERKGRPPQKSPVFGDSAALRVMQPARRKRATPAGALCVAPQWAAPRRTAA